MTKSRLLSLAAPMTAAVMLAFAGPALAQGQGSGGPGSGMGPGPGAGMKSGPGAGMGPGGNRADRRAARIMEILDTDQDEKVSLKEITDEQKRMLGAIDIDGDGTLSVDEFKRRGRLLMSLRTTSYFDLMDANGDGKLSAEEIAAPSQRWFKRYDENKDGSLVTSEPSLFSS